MRRKWPLMTTMKSGNSIRRPLSFLGETELITAIAHLRASDLRLRRVIDKHGSIDFKPGGDIFESLVESILSQQLASAAANSIISKVKLIYAPRAISPHLLLGTPARRLRSAGVSPQKLTYLKDLAAKVCNGSVSLKAIPGRADSDVITILDDVKGIGRWTAQMLMIFTLGRPDVLPVDDLGIRKAVQKIYSLKKLPDARIIERIAKPWHPYCSVASLYLWREKDGK